MSYKRSKDFTIFKKKKIKYLLLNNKSQITVVFFHGFMSDMTGKKPKEIQKFCTKNKINFLKFEYSGHGRSSGEFINGNISQWTIEAKKLIKAKAKNKLIFVGSSMGSWIALNSIKSFKKKIKGFVGIASAPDFLEELMWKKFNKKIKKIIRTKKIYNLKRNNYVYPITKQLITDGRKNKMMEEKINIKIIVTLIHGLKDKIVPLKFSSKLLRIFKNSNKKLVKVKNGDHSLSRKSDLKKITNELKLILLGASDFN